MLSRWLALLPLAIAAACADVPDDSAPDDDPNAGLLRDFLGGKFDAAGHPLNAKVLPATTLCGTRTLTARCEGALPDGAQAGELVANVRLRVLDHATRGDIVTATLLDTTGAAIAHDTLTVARLRSRDGFIDLPVQLAGRAASAIRIDVASGARIELDYVEIFPRQFGLVVAPGSGVIADDEWLAFELPSSKRLERLTANGVDLLPHLRELEFAGLATRTTTGFRTLIEVRVGDLLPDRGALVDLRATTTGDAVRTQLRRSPPACDYAGDPAGTRVLVTGFQPFPADGWHDNVSEVAVTAMDPARLVGAQVMRLVLPVEYDRAAATIADVIDRCAPAAVLSFGQGGSAIALEEVAYNLQDTGEIAGGVPDNRGIIRAAAPIDPAAAAERATLLPLAAIEDALVAAGEDPRRSRDPGRYICNNVMFGNVGVMQRRGHGVAGFIHLPYTTSFDAATRARYGRVAEAAVQATVDAL